MIPKPSDKVAVVLASIAVHAEEMLSPTRSRYDVTTIQTLLGDAELRSYLVELDKLALLPVKR